MATTLVPGSNSPVLPAPERLDGTKNCELAAVIATLGFTHVDDAVKVVQGDGVPGGRLGYWRFLPRHPQGRYLLRAVLHHGLDACQAGLDAAPARVGGRAVMLPVYREQAYMAAALHNRRLLVESVRLGTRLRLEKCGYLFVFRRIEGREVPEMAGAETVQGLMMASTRRTELAAALATLGFEPVRVPAGSAAVAEAGLRVTHEGGGVAWMLPARSSDGRWDLQERMARWLDDAWSAREENTDPIACLADCFWNLGHLRREQVKARNVLVRVQNGSRSVLMAATAPDREWERASNFLKGRG